MEYRANPETKCRNIWSDGPEHWLFAKEFENAQGLTNQIKNASPKSKLKRCVAQTSSLASCVDGEMSCGQTCAHREMKLDMTKTMLQIKAATKKIKPNQNRKSLQRCSRNIRTRDFLARGLSSLMERIT